MCMNHTQSNSGENKNSNHHDSKHMWWMMAGCILLPIIFLLFSGRVKSGGGNWPWLIFMILFIILHAGMVFGHGKRKENNDNREGLKPEKDKQAKREHSC